MVIRSIKRNLLLWLLIPLLALMALVSANAYYSSLKIANTVYDRALYDSVLTLGILVRKSPGDDRVTVDLPPDARRMLEVDPMDKIYYVVKSLNGTAIIGDASLAVPDAASLKDALPVFFDSRHHDKPIRVSVARVFPQGDLMHPVIVAVAETLKKRQAMAGEILVQSVLPQLLFLIVAVVMVLFAIRRSLRPLAEISAAVNTRSSLDFDPIPSDRVPIEIKPLTKAFNNLMRRFEESFSLQKRFVANAAHQLRTPVAGMRAIVEAELMGVAAEDRPPSLVRLQRSTQRMSRLVNQLLVLSRAEPGNPMPMVRLELGALAHAVIDEYQVLAAARAIHLHESAEPGLFIMGNAAMLGEMIGNLIDNAIRYSPDHSQVSIRLSRHDDGIRLTVDDEGPGIPMHEAEKIFERFYRGEQTTEEGTGLGLAIVKEIADAHEAKISIHTRADGKGTRAQVAWSIQALENTGIE